MNLKNQKKLAARALGVSVKRVKLSIDPSHKKDLKEIISREGVRELKEEGIIKELPKKGNSRTRANHIASQKKKGRRSGQGKRKGTANARFNKKDKWIIKIRGLRAYIKKLKDEGKIENKVYKDLYAKSKGNFFRNKRHVSIYIEQHNLVSKGGKE